jgi:putative ATP-dependent endonuclease of OLD family
MHLAHIAIRGFRRLDELHLDFAPGLNLLVGPNNIGKTAVIDGLRALHGHADDGGLWIGEHDFRIDKDGKKAESICFDYVFRGLNHDEQATFFTALVPVVDGKEEIVDYEARFSVRYSQLNAEGRVSVRRSCGVHDDNAVPAEMMDELRAVYLQPLRDPAFGLRPGRASQLSRLVRRMADDAEQEDIVATLAQLDTELTAKAPMVALQQSVESRHEQMLGLILKQALKVGLAPLDFKRIAARLSLAVESFDIEQNGLGYNNLIYMAVVLSELSSTPDTSYKALIVEEPEAHLHPQLQSVLLDYLQSKDHMPSNGAGAVQVFVTSHSPHFASQATLGTIASLHQRGTSVGAFFPRTVQFEATTRAKLQRYLDVTRAELFFSRRLILVEGASELFLIDAFAKKQQIDLRHHAVSVLSTAGLNFDAFLPLFGKDRLDIGVAVLTDADPPGKYPNASDPLVLSDAAKKIKAAESSNVQVFIAKKTLEYDMALLEANHEPMLQALNELHPRIAVDLRNKLASTESAEKPKVLFQGLFERSGGVRVQKGAFAQALAQVVESDAMPLVPPDYVVAALKFITS